MNSKINQVETYIIRQIEELKEEIIQEERNNNSEEDYLSIPNFRTCNVKTTNKYTQTLGLIYANILACEAKNIRQLEKTIEDETPFATAIKVHKFLKSCEFPEASYNNTEFDIGEIAKQEARKAFTRFHPNSFNSYSFLTDIRYELFSIYKDQDANLFSIKKLPEDTYTDTANGNSKILNFHINSEKKNICKILPFAYH